MNKQQRVDEGFTIIEIMIVLTIAAVILIIVFFAVPALQRNQRNARRARDASALAALVRECLSNNQNDTLRCYTPEQINLDPSKTFSFFTGAHFWSHNPPGSPNDPWAADDENMVWAYGLRCNPELTNFVEGQASPRDLVVGYRVERVSQLGWTGKCLDG